MTTKFTKEQIAFAELLENEVSPALAAFARRHFDAGYSVDDVKESLRAACRVVDGERS